MLTDIKESLAPGIGLRMQTRTNARGKLIGEKVGNKTGKDHGGNLVSRAKLRCSMKMMR